MNDFLAFYLLLISLTLCCILFFLGIVLKALGEILALLDRVRLLLQEIK
jgi:hypothetical protein